ncbi:MAG TPA: rRNA adenine N-6-methyltransferase family protein [Rhizomicrobium sp.]|jgi:phosphatidylethanolamine/phosphatidyl-N-methylethanolamine N-methyltransferase|nr:rRNA adenine N-6-methyltransferase family protein [Rhizomicrobium sp.]
MANTTAAEHLHFIRGLIARPKNVGAIAPSSPQLARAIARQIDPAIPGPVLELGPGTGVVTEALIERGVAPERITAIEYDADFAKLVAQRFPKVHVVRGDAFDLKRTLGNGDGERFAAIVSGLPLLNHPLERRHALIEGALAKLQPGAPYIQFSYGFQPPIAAPAGATVKRAAFVWRNLPPARVWVYRTK